MLLTALEEFQFVLPEFGRSQFGEKRSGAAAVGGGGRRAQVTRARADGSATACGQLGIQCEIQY